MHSRQLVALAAALVLSTACRSAASVTPTGTPAPAAAPAAMAQPAAPAQQYDPSGRWSVALTAQGQPFDFIMELRRGANGEFGGTVTSQQFPPMNINKATLNGNQMRIFITAPTGDEASFNITFTGDTFSGEWSMPGDGSRVSGRRI